MRGYGPVTQAVCCLAAPVARPGREVVHGVAVAGAGAEEGCRDCRTDPHRSGTGGGR